MGPLVSVCAHRWVDAPPPSGTSVALHSDRRLGRPFFYPRGGTERIFSTVMNHGGSSDLRRARPHNIDLCTVGYHGGS
jgi:hypothetical protein